MRTNISRQTVHLIKGIAIHTVWAVMNHSTLLGHKKLVDIHVSRKHQLLGIILLEYKSEVHEAVQQRYVSLLRYKHPCRMLTSTLELLATRSLVKAIDS
jgi:hypothetical protein